jgi:hypothetical protein
MVTLRPAAFVLRADDRGIIRKDDTASSPRGGVAFAGHRRDLPD